MPRAEYVIKDFDWSKTLVKLAKGAKRGVIRGDITDDIVGDYSKEVLSAKIRVNSDAASFQLSQYGTVTLYHSDNSKFKKARFMLRKLIAGGRWIPKRYVPDIAVPSRGYDKTRLMLGHSKLLISDLDTINLEDFVFRYPYSVRWGGHIDQHLRSGYPKLRRKIPRIKSMPIKLSSMITPFENELAERASKILYSIFDSPNKAGEVIYKDLRSAASGSSSRLSSSIQVENVGNAILGDPNAGFLACPGYMLGLGDSEKCEVLKKFMDREIKSRDNLKRCKEIMSFEEKYYWLLSEVKGELRSITDRAKHGTPLRGRCDLCP